MSNWKITDMPSQYGKTAIVTGSTSGVGICIALELARAGAHVILAARDPQKASRIADQIRGEVPQANISYIQLDLSSLALVRDFAQAFLSKYSTLDLLINNAGVAAIPYQRTVDGFEAQLGTNHLGHFALTGLLFPALLATPNARVITVASGASNTGKINFDDLQSKQSYSRYRAYSQSKYANLLFMQELQRRIDVSGLPIKSIASQPGWTATNLGPGKSASLLEQGLWAILNRIFAHSPAQGALPTLYAATVPDLAGGCYISPSGFGGLHGPPAIISVGKAAQDHESAKRLWEVSEDLTGVRYTFTNVPTMQ